MTQARPEQVRFPFLWRRYLKTPSHFISHLAYLEVGPTGKKFAAPSGIIQSLRCRYKSSPEIIYVVDDDVEDIFGHILQYLHSGDYSVLIPAADSSSHAACEDEIEIAI